MRIIDDDGNPSSLPKLAQNLVKLVNGIKNKGEKFPGLGNYINGFADRAAKNEEEKQNIIDYLSDAIYWNPAYRRYGAAKPLVGYGEGDMISVRDRLGGSIRGYGHRRRRRGGSIVGKGIFGLARKANKFARKTKILSKGARLLGYGMDSAGFLDKAW